jgi:hypothetical protein
MIAAGAIARGAQGAFPGALAGSLAAALLLAVVSWFWFRALRRAQADIFGANPTTTSTNDLDQRPRLPTIDPG